MRLCLIPYLHTPFFSFLSFLGGIHYIVVSYLPQPRNQFKKTGNGITIFNKYMHVLLTCASLIAM